MTDTNGALALTPALTPTLTFTLTFALTLTHTLTHTLTLPLPKPKPSPNLTLTNQRGGEQRPHRESTCDRDHAIARATLE